MADQSILQDKEINKMAYERKGSKGGVCESELGNFLEKEIQYKKRVARIP